MLRATDRDRATLQFYTDLRSAKIAVVLADRRVALAGYDPDMRLQLRLRGDAAVSGSGDAVDARWARLGPASRRNYQTALPPGTVLDAPGDGLGDAFADGGRANFAVVTVTLDRLEWLRLGDAGHRRAAYARVAGAWTGSWRIP